MVVQMALAQEMVVQLAMTPATKGLAIAALATVAQALVSVMQAQEMVVSEAMGLRGSQVGMCVMRIRHPCGDGQWRGRHSTTP